MRAAHRRAAGVWQEARALVATSRHVRANDRSPLRRAMPGANALTLALTAAMLQRRGLW